jgi:hypothetical protein
MDDDVAEVRNLVRFPGPRDRQFAGWTDLTALALVTRIAALAALARRAGHAGQAILARQSQLAGGADVAALAALANEAVIAGLSALSHRPRLARGTRFPALATFPRRTRLTLRTTFTRLTLCAGFTCWAHRPVADNSEPFRNRCRKFFERAIQSGLAGHPHLDDLGANFGESSPGLGCNRLELGCN